MSVKPMTRRRWLAGLLFSLVALPALAEWIDAAGPETESLPQFERYG